jgi:hypothetical protein
MSDIETAVSSPQSAPVEPPGPIQDPGSGDMLMRRRAAAVLEVLGGAKSPPEAAETLGIALPSYYLLETRALEGLIAACEPRPRGRSSGEGRSVQAMKRENERLRQDLTRLQALTRAVQQAAGMPSKSDAPVSEGRARRRRRATARALRAAQRLAVPVESTGPSLPTSPLAVESLP